FAIALGGIPVALCASAAWLTRSLATMSESVMDIAIRYAYALVPFGVGVWVAHYGFHFLTGIWTIVPVAQSALLLEPDWRWLGMRPGAVFPLQIGAVVLGTFGALVLAYRISERDAPDRALRAAVPWIVVISGLALLALWILAQPMEMRGTGLGG